MSAIVQVKAGRVIVRRDGGFGLSLNWEDAYDLARTLQHAADRAKAEDDAMRQEWVRQRLTEQPSSPGDQ